MRRYLFAAAASAMLLAAASPAHGTMVGLSFCDTYKDWPDYNPNFNNVANVTLATAEVVGAPGASSAGWYNSPNLSVYHPTNGYIQSNVPVMTLTDSNGTLTSATLKINPGGTGLNGMATLSGGGAWYTDGADGGLSAVDRLYNANLLLQGGRVTEISLAGIPYSQYSLYVYLVHSQYQSGNVQLFKGGVASGSQAPVYYSNGLSWVPLNQWGGYPDSGYTQITGTDSANATATGNTGAYVLFEGLTQGAQTIDVVGTGGVAAIQIVPVPEPATLGVLGASVVALLVRRRSQV